MKLLAFLPVLGVFGVNNILIDTDPGVDDVMAFLMAFGDPDVNVRAITMTFGNSVLKNVARNLCSVFYAMDLQAKETGKEKYRHNDIPRLAVGAARPLQGPLYTAGYFHGIDGLGNLTLTHPELIDTRFQDYFDYDFDKDAVPSKCNAQNRTARRTSDRFTVSPFDAADEILFQLKSLPPFTLTIVAIGPLTNIALAIQRDPVTMSRVKRIVVMGGALLVPGNVTPMAEFNFYADPYAVNVVFNATRGFSKDTYHKLLTKRNPRLEHPLPLRVTLAPVNLTLTTLMPKKTMERYLAGIEHQPIPTFYGGMLEIPFQKSEKIHGLALHDPTAMGIALGLIQPSIKRYAIQVVEDSEIARGLCVIDLRAKAKASPGPNDTSIEVAYAADHPDWFQYALLKTSFPRQK